MVEIGLRSSARRSCAPQRRNEGSACCFRPDVPIERPDPAIYSQKRTLAASGSPTWDSPDILTNSWSPWRLLPESHVTVRNLSNSVTAANVQVGLSFSPFGIGMPVSPLGAQFVSLAPSASADLLFPLSQALLAGDQLVSVFVRIVHNADADLSNNEGEQAILGGRTSELGRVIEFEVPVRNPAAYAQTMTFITYANDLGLTVTPVQHGFAPFEQIVVHGRIHVPAALHVSSGFLERAATMAAFGTGGALIGGITYVVHIDD